MHVRFLSFDRVVFATFWSLARGTRTRTAPLCLPLASSEALTRWTVVLCVLSSLKVRPTLTYRVLSLTHPQPLTVWMVALLDTHCNNTSLSLSLVGPLSCVCCLH